MADDISQLVDGLRLITAQKSIEDEAPGTKTKGKKGVIIDSKAGNKKSREKEKPVSATLTSNETTRYTKIFEILRNVINPDPEAARTGDTAKDKVKGMSATTEGAAGAKEAEGGLLEKLGAIGLLLASLGSMLWGFIKKKFFEYMGKFLKFLRRSFVKLLKGIGKLMLRFGKFLWNSAKKAAKAIWRGLKKVGKRLLGFLKKTASKVGGAIRSMFSGLWNSKWANALKGAVRSAFEAMKGFLSKALNMVKGGAKAITTATSAAVNSARGKPSKPSTPKPSKPSLRDRLWNWGAKKVKQTGSALKATGSAISNVASKTYEGAKYVAGKTYEAGKYIKNQTVKGIKYVGNVTSKVAKATIGKAASAVVGKGAGGLIKFLGGAARKIPIIGPIIEGLFTAYEIKQLKERFAAGEIDEDELHQAAGRRVITGIGGAVGAGAGAILAGIVTSFTGPGAVVAAIAGGVLGDIAGRILSGVFADYIIPEKYTKSIGEYFVGPDPAKGAEGSSVADLGALTPRASSKSAASQKRFNDGVITHGGQTVRINSKDDVLALKTGGPLDSMFKALKTRGSLDSMFKSRDSNRSEGVKGVIDSFFKRFKSKDSNLNRVVSNTGKGVKGVFDSFFKRFKSEDSNEIKAVPAKGIDSIRNQDLSVKSKNSSGIQDAAVFNDIKSVNIAQLEILTSIRDGIMALGRNDQVINKGKSGGPSTLKQRPNIATAEYYGKQAMV